MDLVGVLALINSGGLIAALGFLIRVSYLGGRAMQRLANVENRVQQLESQHLAATVGRVDEKINLLTERIEGIRSATQELKGEIVGIVKSTLELQLQIARGQAK